LEEMKPTWKKITGEEYTEKGPVKVEKKKRRRRKRKRTRRRKRRRRKKRKRKLRKKEDKKEEKKEEKHTEKHQTEKKEEKHLTEKEVKEEKKEDDKKYKDLQQQIDELKKTIILLQNTKSVSNIFVHKPNSLKSWNLSLKNSFEIGLSSYVKSIAINYEQDLVVFGTKHGHILTYRLSSFEKVNSAKPHNGTVRDIIYLFDGKHVISARNDGKIVKTDVTSHLSKESSHILPGQIKSLAYSQDGYSLYAACGRVLYFYDITDLDGKYEHKVHDFGEELLKVIFIKEYKYLALGFRDGSVKLFDIGIQQVIAEFRDHEKRITDLAVTRINGGVALATTAKDMKIHVYDVESKQKRNSINIPSKSNSHASKLIYGYDEKTVFTLHNDGKIILNQYQTGSLEKEQTNKHLISTEAKLSAGFYTGDGSTFIVAMQPDSEGGSGKIEIYGSTAVYGTGQQSLGQGK